MSREERVKDLVRAFVDRDGGASRVGPLKRDYEWLADKLADVLETEVPPTIG